VHQSVDNPMYDAAAINNADLEDPYADLGGDDKDYEPMEFVSPYDMGKSECAWLWKRGDRMKMQWF
jgi:hypothetical protein